MYGALVAEKMLNKDFEMAFIGTEEVSGSMWGDLEKLSQGEGWPL